MKQFLRYLYDARPVWEWGAVSAAAFAAVFALYGADIRMVWYPLLITAVFGLIFLLRGFYRYRKRHQRLKNILCGGRPFSEMLPEAESLTEKDYQELLVRTEEAQKKERELWEEKSRDLADYYAVWVHQIKAPIAVMRVILQQEDTAENRELAAELFRVEQYAEMALTYIRLGEGSSDLVIQEYSLDPIIRRAVRKYAAQFVRKKLRLVYNGTEVKVITDEKWLSFILEQLLSNAVKYTARGSVMISVDDRKRLTVEDTGIGIAPEDLPRIFEKGYTGYNGRTDRRSTGIGLYLCRMAADRLGHRLAAESEPGKGSRFTVDLASYELKPE